MRGWRPIPAALHTPFRRSLFRGGRPSLSPTGQNFPDEAVSIGKVTDYVKRKSNRASGKLFGFSSLSHVPTIIKFKRAAVQHAATARKARKPLFYNWLHGAFVPFGPLAVLSKLIPQKSPGILAKRAQFVFGYNSLNQKLEVTSVEERKAGSSTFSPESAVRDLAPPAPGGAPEPKLHANDRLRCGAISLRGFLFPSQRRDLRSSWFPNA